VADHRLDHPTFCILFRLIYTSNPENWMRNAGIDNARYRVATARGTANYGKAGQRIVGDQFR
jgi:hypothetical protein